jgi:simple sugar transport system permease protein
MNDSVIMNIIVAGIVFGAPLVYAVMGEMVSQRAGIMNLSLDGTMLVSAAAGYGVSVLTNSLWLALGTAILVGFLAISLRVSQILAGLGLLIFSGGMSAYIGRIGDNPLIGRNTEVAIEPYSAGSLTDIPILGPILFGHDFIVYGAWILVAVTYFYLNHTEGGLRVRAVGNDPASAEAAGVSVARVRAVHCIIGGALAGLGGVYYTLGLTNIWQERITTNAGWLAFAIVMVARWRPLVGFAAAFLFGATIRLGFTLQVAGTALPPEILSMIPYMLAIAAVLYTALRPSKVLTEPRALGIPFFREER